MGYKGYVQLGLRTGQYERMNARVVNEEAFQGWDEVGEPIIDWSVIDESKPAIGYVFAFKLVNGFTKIAYWPKDRVETHAKRFSQSYKSGFDSPWKSDFDSMALKTVIKNELAKWGILSIEMVNAIKHDQAVKQTLDSDPEFPDGPDYNGNGSNKPEIISEEQRTALVKLAQDKGVIEKLGEIVNGAGFEMLANITVEAFCYVEQAIINAANPSSDANAIDADAVDVTDESKSEPQAVQLSVKDEVSQSVFLLQKEHGVKDAELKLLLPDGVKKFSDLSEEQAVDVLPSVQQLLESKKAG
jgi:hypothetical protein